MTKEEAINILMEKMTERHKGAVIDSWQITEDYLNSGHWVMWYHVVGNRSTLAVRTVR
jgi:hypothetical protein